LIQIVRYVNVKMGRNQTDADR